MAEKPSSRYRQAVYKQATDTGAEGVGLRKQFSAPLRCIAVAVVGVQPDAASARNPWFQATPKPRAPALNRIGSQLISAFEAREPRLMSAHSTTIGSHFSDTRRTPKSRDLLDTQDLLPLHFS